MSILPAPQVQMLYTNVDHVVDGVQRSGWQLMTCQPEVAPQLRERLTALIQPELELVTPLPDFPSPQEQETAGRRLVQRPTADGVVLTHTAPAGADTTGRANTMSHVVLLADEPAPTVYTTELWRSTGWSTPWGPDGVRQAHVAGPGAFTTGDVVTEERVAELVAQPGAGATLARLADLLCERLDARVAGRAACGPVVVVPVSSCDEAAVWFGALERTMAPATARHLSWSTFVRVPSQLEADRLASSGLDLVAVPVEDRCELVAAHEGLVLVPRPQDEHGASAASFVPTTAWGSLVAAATATPATWATARETMTDLVLSFLPDHRDVSPAWPLAMVEAASPGLMSAYAGAQQPVWEDGPAQGAPGGGSDPALGGVDLVVDRELISCQPRALSDPDAEYLQSLASERVLDVEEASAAAWWDRLMVLPASAAEDGASGVAGAMVERFVEACGEDSHWLLEAQPAASPTAAAVVGAWLAGSQGRERRTLLPGRVRACVEAAVGPGQVGALLQAASTMVRCGVEPDDAFLSGLLAPVIDRLWAASVAEVEEVDVPAPLRQALVMRLEDRLRDYLRSATVPVVIGNAHDPWGRWLLEGLSSATPVTTLMALGALTDAPAADRALWSQAWREAASAVPGARLAPTEKLRSWLAQWVSAEQVQWFRPVMEQVAWADLASLVAVRTLGTSQSYSLASACLAAGGLASQPPFGVQRADQPLWQSRCVLSVCACVPMVTQEVVVALAWADAALEAWLCLVDRDPAPALSGPLRAVAERALVVSSAAEAAGYRAAACETLTRWGAMSHAPGVVASVLEMVRGLADRVAQGQVAAYTPMDTGVGAMVGLGVVRVAQLEVGIAPTQWGQGGCGPGGTWQMPTDPVAVVVAVARERVRMLGEAGRREIELLLPPGDEDDEAQRWLARHVFGQSRLPKALSRLRGR